jgi:2-dehydro-3-deoxyphosphooctonate aldolase (KDO 8-P synthase)
MSQPAIVHVDTIGIGGSNPVTLIAGPCVIESRDLVMSTAENLAETCSRLGIPFIFKSSYRKANRTSLNGFTGIGDEKALGVLQEVKNQFKVPVLTDVHSESEVEMASEFVDVLQIPAFLSRQTELLLAAGKSGAAVNIKKGQFLAPEDMQHAAEKVASTGNSKILLCERGSSFGYHNLVVDMRGLVIMRALGYPVVMDATHAVQRPSQGSSSGGDPEYILPLARAACAVGVDALFIETHPNPAEAMSDAASQLSLPLVEPLLRQVMEIDAVVKRS